MPLGRVNAPRGTDLSARCCVSITRREVPMHQPKPWFRASRGKWYVQLAGKQIPLVEGEANEEAAWSVYHALMASQGRMEVREDVAFLALAELFLDHAERRNKPATYKWYKHYLDWFCGHYEGLAAEVKPAHVNGWLQDETYGTRRGGINAVKRVLTWAHREGHLRVNPLAGLPNLPAMRREPVGKVPRSYGGCSGVHVVQRLRIDDCPARSRREQLGRFLGRLDDNAHHGHLEREPLPAVSASARTRS